MRTPKRCLKYDSIRNFHQIDNIIMPDRNYFHQKNNYKRIKANEDQDIKYVFCGGSEKSRIHLIPKWPPFQCSFVYLHISLVALFLNSIWNSKEYFPLNGAKRANLQVNKRILKWRPYWNKVYWIAPRSRLKFFSETFRTWKINFF